MDLAAQLRQLSLKNFAIAGGWIVLFIACIFSYFPGLDGPFVFDDFGSLSALGDRGGVKDWSSFKAFVFGGHAGPTGRPLALFSFLIDANDWPADAWAFKRTNLVVHLINGALLGGLVFKILGFLRIDRQTRRWASLLTAAGWLLHPFLVSTTLYAVQRMAQLSTMFTFAGLIAYLHFRATLANRAFSAYVGMSLSIGMFTALAMICKENGILLPLLIGVIEITIVASQRDNHAALNRVWAALFLFLPFVVIVVYLGRLVLKDNFFDIVPPRDFSAYERVLTQARVLVDYLQHWFTPSLFTTGVFQDHFIKSTGMVAPVSTLLSALLHLTLLTVALIRRRRWPLFALAVLFFYTGHLLESTVVNLEMYFEHRNYLAAAFLFLPLIVLFQQRVSRQWFVVGTIGALLVLAGFTRYTATIWKDYSSMVAVAAKVAPTSVRAQTQYATDLYNERRFDESLRVLDRAIVVNPTHTSLLITRATILCRLGILSSDDFGRAARTLSANVYDPRSIRLYTVLVTTIADRQCPGVPLATLRKMFTDMLQQPRNGSPRSLRYSQIKYFVGLVDVHAGRPARAVTAFEASLRARSGAEHAMMMAAVLASGDYYNEALHFSGIALAELVQGPAKTLQGATVKIDDVRIFESEIRELMPDCASGPTR